ncbi:MAG: hypothetical protein HY319_10950 [Armatimonadetes bacterium]|nr:hypothetical protein [Armatimonadota bacterium]
MASMAFLQPSPALLESLERDTGSPEAARDAGRILSDYLASRPQLGSIYRELLPRLGDPWAR